MNINRGFVAYKTTSAFSGVDKVHAISKDFDVKDTTHFGIAPNHKKQGETDYQQTPLFRCAGKKYLQPDGEIGEMVWGSRAYHNAPKEMGNLSINIDFRGCEITFNPSKLLGKFSGELATPEEVHQTAGVIEKYLSEIGISTNLSSYKLTRVDIAKDREMDDLFFTYKPAIVLLKSPRQKTRREYDDGISFGNKQRQDCFYDKGLEMNPEDGGSKLMRSEFRLLKSESVDSVLNISHFMQLKDMSPQDISDVHIKHITKDLFKIKTPEQQSFSFMGDVALLKTFREQGKRNAVMEWVMLMGISNLVETRGGIDGIKLILETAGFDRSYIYRCILKISSMIHQSSFLSDAPTISTKYEEIRTKFVA